MLTSLGDTDIGLEDLREIGEELLGSGEGGMGESGGMLAKYLWKRKKCESQTYIGYVDVNQKKNALAGISFDVQSRYITPNSHGILRFGRDVTTRKI